MLIADLWSQTAHIDAFICYLFVSHGHGSTQLLMADHERLLMMLLWRSSLVARVVDVKS